MAVGYGWGSVQAVKQVLTIGNCIHNPQNLLGMEKKNRITFFVAKTRYFPTLLILLKLFL